MVLRLRRHIFDAERALLARSLQRTVLIERGGTERLLIVLQAAAVLLSRGRNLWQWLVDDRNVALGGSR